MPSYSFGLYFYLQTKGNFAPGCEKEQIMEYTKDSMSSSPSLPHITVDQHSVYQKHLLTDSNWMGAHAHPHWCKIYREQDGSASFIKIQSMFNNLHH